jgi:hypothetical protein
VYCLTSYSSITPDNVYVSSGEGIVRDVYTMTFMRLCGDVGNFTKELLDGMHVPKPLFAHASMLVPEDRVNHMVKLGALCAKMISMGFSLVPLDPCFILLVVFDFNLQALPSSFVSYFHPQLYQSIIQFQEVGSDGNIQDFLPFFSTHMDIESVPLLYL